MKKKLLCVLCSFALLAAAGCESNSSAKLARAKAALASSGIDAATAAAITARFEAAPDRFLALLGAAGAEMQADPGLLRRVDKKIGLPSDFVPADLVSLDGTGLAVSKAGQKMRKPAVKALQEMSKAARADGVTLLVSSAFRSYEYQKTLFARYVAEMGEKEASRVSAPPGMSQHQLGSAADFGSITDDFATTAAGKWMTANAGKYGFSLSFPKGMESITGYKWECWHYRYIGLEAVALQNEFFGGVQHYLMLFLDAFSRAPQKG